eukprot:TRINITY_DN3620_c0_g1_i4.p1 TRINITY_DN3620_c0_g1~~TRINITY_DN3620_c0_g1_i4.p1  ORF type:complete len:266 (+),score=11.74 TRINITY_DN3620_c0_g1_i4:148-945(+)
MNSELLLLQQNDYLAKLQQLELFKHYEPTLRVHPVAQQNHQQKQKQINKQHQQKQPQQQLNYPSPQHHHGYQRRKCPKDSTKTQNPPGFLKPGPLHSSKKPNTKKDSNTYNSTKQTTALKSEPLNHQAKRQIGQESNKIVPNLNLNPKTKFSPIKSLDTNSGSGASTIDSEDACTPKNDLKNSKNKMLKGVKVVCDGETVFKDLYYQYSVEKYQKQQKQVQKQRQRQLVSQGGAYEDATYQKKAFASSEVMNSPEINKIPLPSFI